MPLDAPIALTDRLRGRVLLEFGADRGDAAAELLERVDLGDWRSTTSADGRERVLAAILILAQGDPERLIRFARDAERDWRDVLVFAELAQPDWPERLDAYLSRRVPRAG
jgi:hypothetical protein